MQYYHAIVITYPYCVQTTDWLPLTFSSSHIVDIGFWGVAIVQIMSIC